MFLVYEVLLYLVFIVTAPFFLLTGFLRGKYLSNFPERMGVYRTKAAAHDLWIHAVSVGETLAARPVVLEIMRQRPGTSIAFTTTTITGQAQAKRLYPNATVTYFPSTSRSPSAAFSIITGRAPSPRWRRRSGRTCRASRKRAASA